MGRSTAATAFGGEYEPDFYGADEVLRQGDILQMIPRDGQPAADPWARHFAVVVTANCDLAFRKHSGVLTYVPIVPLDVYAHNIAIPRLFEQRREKTLEKIAEILAEANESERLGRIHEMLELGQEVPVAKLFGDGFGPAERLTYELGRFAVYRRAIDDLAGSDSLEITLTTFHSVGDELDRLGGQKNNQKDLNGALKTCLGKAIPGDSLFLSALSENHAEGYVAVLRLIREISESVISLTAVEERRRPGVFAARRIGRLGVLYCHKLVQHMAKVFTDIGLPEEYERSRDESIGAHLDGWLSGAPKNGAAR